MILYDYVPRTVRGYAAPRHLDPLVEQLERSWTHRVRCAAHAPPRHSKTESVLLFLALTLWAYVSLPARAGRARLLTAAADWGGQSYTSARLITAGKAWLDTQQALADLGLEPGRYILAVGRLVPEKGFHHLVEAFVAARPGCKLAIAGAAMAALMGSFTTTVLLLDSATLNQYRFWAVGSFSGRDSTIAAQVAPLVFG